MATAQPHRSSDDKKKGALGYETKFNFKWIPDLKNFTTPLGDPVPDQVRRSGALQPGGVERTALIVLVFTGVMLGLATWTGVRAATSLVGAAARNLDWEKTAAPLWGLVRSIKS